MTIDEALASLARHHGSIRFRQESRDGEPADLLVCHRGDFRSIVLGGEHSRTPAEAVVYLVGKLDERAFPRPAEPPVVPLANGSR